MHAKLNKKSKGISNVVAVLMLSLLSVAAVALLGTTIIKLTKSPLLAPSVACLDLKVQGSPLIRSACFNPLSQETEVTIYRPLTSVDINQIKFSLSGNGVQEDWLAGLSCNNNLLEKGETKKYYFSSNSPPQEVKLIIGDCTVDSKPISICGQS